MACSASRAKKNAPKMNTEMNRVSFTASPAASKKAMSGGNSSRGRSKNRMTATMMASVRNMAGASSRPSLVMVKVVGLKASTEQATRMTPRPNCDRRNQGSTIMAVPASTASRRAVAFDSPKSQKITAVM